VPERIGGLFHFGAGAGIDDAGAGVFRQNLAQLGHRVAQSRPAPDGGVVDVGPVIAADDPAIIGNGEMGGNVGGGMCIRRGGQAQALGGMGVKQWQQGAVIGAEIMAPFRHAMRLVHGEEGDGYVGQQRGEVLTRGAFGRDIEQIERPPAQQVDGAA
jgi:hypothetical protein